MLLWCCLRSVKAGWFQLLSLGMKFNSMTIQMKASEHHFPVVPFITLYWVVLTFKSVDEISKYDSMKDTEQYCTVTLFTLYTP